MKPEVVSLVLALYLSFSPVLTISAQEITS